jgi:hypothetical protein
VASKAVLVRYFVLVFDLTSAFAIGADAASTTVLVVGAIAPQDALSVAGEAIAVSHLPSNLQPARPVLAEGKSIEEHLAVLSVRYASKFVTVYIFPRPFPPPGRGKCILSLFSA